MGLFGAPPGAARDARQREHLVYAVGSVRFRISVGHLEVETLIQTIFHVVPRRYVLLAAARGDALSSGLPAGPREAPPSTGNTIPVTCADLSLGRYRAALATSAGTPLRRSG